MKLFVWENGLRGPVPAIYHHGLPVDCDTGKVKGHILQVVEVPQHLNWMKLKHLEKVYPFKVVA